MDTAFCGSWKTRSLTPDPSYGNTFLEGVYRNSFGCRFHQLPTEFPWLSPFYSQLELHFNSLHFVGWSERNLVLPVVICAVYLVLALWVGPALMKGRDPLPCKNQLAVWNLLLAVFSAIGFLRTAPHLLYFGAKFGPYASICAPAETSFGQGAVGLWTMLFIFSKVPELVDTLFLVIAKKDVIFLHWYHHFSVLLYCWHSYATRSSAGLYFVSMNYGVHALMYFYFFLTSCGYRPRWNGIVTFLQISQMFVGVAVCTAVAYYMFYLGVPCDITVSNFAAGILMYGSYFVLFALFAMGKYGAPSKAGKERKGKGKEQVTDDGEKEAQEPPPSKGFRANKKRA